MPAMWLEQHNSELHFRGRAHTTVGDSAVSIPQMERITGRSQCLSSVGIGDDLERYFDYRRDHIEGPPAAPMIFRLDFPCRESSICV